MQVLTILAHPGSESFNHALCARVTERLKADGHDIRLHDLYQEGFDPVLPVEETTRAEPDETVLRYVTELGEADGLIVVHPNWWGSPPAILKGWVDRVFRAGSAYRFVDRGDGVGIPEGMLKADRAVILNTANSTPAAEWGAIDPLEMWWRNTVLGMCGIGHVHRKLYAPVITSSQEQRDQWLQDAEDISSEIFGSMVCPV